MNYSDFICDYNEQPRARILEFGRRAVYYYFAPYPKRDRYARLLSGLDEAAEDFRQQGNRIEERSGGEAPGKVAEERARTL